MVFYRMEGVTSLGGSRSGRPSYCFEQVAQPSWWLLLLVACGPDSLLWVWFCLCRVLPAVTRSLCRLHTPLLCRRSLSDMPSSSCCPCILRHRLPARPRGRLSSHVKVWSRTLRSEGATPKKEAGEDAAEVRARAAFGACVSAINAVDSLSYRFAEVRAFKGSDRSVVCKRRASSTTSVY